MVFVMRTLTRSVAAAKVHFGQKNKYPLVNRTTRGSLSQPRVPESGTGGNLNSSFFNRIASLAAATASHKTIKHFSRGDVMKQWKTEQENLNMDFSPPNNPPQWRLWWNSDWREERGRDKDFNTWIWFIPGLRVEQMSSEIESVEFRIEQSCWCLCSDQSYSDPHSASHTAVSQDMSDVTGDWV